MKAKDKIVKAKVKLQKQNPFFAYLVMNLNFKEDKDIESIGVDFKGNCFYNPKFIESLTDNVLKGVLAHEVLHLALEHLLREGNRERRLFNVATDLVINNILVRSNFELPQLQGGLVPYGNEFQFKDGNVIRDLDKKVAEEVYNEIKSNKKLSKELNGDGDRGRFDKHIYAEKGDKGKEFKESKEKWNRAFSEASVYAKQKGNLPQGMDRLLDEVLNEKVNWKFVLYKYLTRTLPYDYTYSRPSKRSFGSGFYMPSILRENLEVVVSVDTSGSISQEELSEFLAEIIGIARTFNNIKITIIVCDNTIKDIYEVGNGDIEKIKNLKIVGGGGTSHIPIYDYIEEYLPNTKFVVNFTDGYTSFPDYEKVKSIWVITKDGCKEEDIPFGEVISLK